MMTDPIADMLARIRNAAMAKLESTQMPLSKVKARIALILKQQGYIETFSVDEASFPKKLTVVLKYGRDRQPAISGIKRSSRPGRRFYVNHREIPEVHNGMGVAVLSTSRGVMTDAEARERCVGGEVLCEVW